MFMNVYIFILCYIMQNYMYIYIHTHIHYINSSLHLIQILTAVYLNKNIIKYNYCNITIIVLYFIQIYYSIYMVVQIIT